MIITLAVMGADICACPDRTDMGSCSDAMAIKTATGANRRHMRARMHATVANTGACSDYRSGMTARSHPVLPDTGACTHSADMGTGPNAVPVHMRADPDAQHMYIQVNRISGG